MCQQLKGEWKKAPKAVCKFMLSATYKYQLDVTILSSAEIVHGG
jgi:hypothetical protein